MDRAHRRRYSQRTRRCVLTCRFALDDARQFRRADYVHLLELSANLACDPLWLLVFVQIDGHFDMQVRSLHLVCSDNS